MNIYLSLAQYPLTLTNQVLHMPESQPPVAPQHRPSPWTLPGLILDRCHEPCPSVIPNTDQPRPNHDPTRTGISPIPSCSKSTSSLPSLDPVLPQCWPDPDYCYLESVIRVKPRQLHQMAVSTNPSSGGRVIQCHYLWGYSKNYWGFQGYSPFHLSTVKTFKINYFIIANFRSIWNREQTGFKNP